MSRQAFEAWCKDHHAVDWAIDLAWLAWQAATMFGMSVSHAKAIRRGAARLGTARNPFAGLMTS